MGVCSQITSAWEAVQVELRGHCSLSRLHEILQYTEHSTLWQCVGLMLVTPLPGLLLKLLMDVLPLSPPEVGVFHQSYAFPLLIFLLLWILAHSSLIQVHQSAPTLPLSRVWVCWISGCTALVGSISTVVAGWLVGFPTPFLMQFNFGWGVTTWGVNLWLAWREVLALDVEAKRRVVHYLKVGFSTQPAMCLVYNSFTIAFNKIPSGYQVYFTLLLPVMKLGFRNWMSKGVVYMEDLAPCMVEFNVDVFHAIFVSSSMQNANSMASVAVIMVFDSVQSMVAFYEMNQILRRMHALAAASVALSNGDARALASRTQSNLKLKLGVIDYALDVLDSNPRIRCHQDLLQPHQRRSESQLRVVPASAVPEKTINRGSPSNVPASIVTTQREGPRIAPVVPAMKHIASQVEHLVPLDQGELAQLQCVKSVLKMLHMVEFYVLIECAEVIVPAMNATYLQVMVYLPNRAYYPSLSSLTTEEMHTQVSRLVLYAGLELLSFVVFCSVMNKRLRRSSAYQILAFVLHKDAWMTHALLITGIFFIGQLGLEHFGNDYTFQFKWLHEKHTTH